MLTRRERTPLRKLMLLGAMAGAGALVEDTATGNPLTFITDKAKPLKSLLIPFTPQQEGSGDPSPSNIRSILPWNGLKVNYIAENMFTGDVNQSVTRTKEIALASPIPAGTYTFTATVDSTTTGSYASFGIAKDRNVVVKLVNIPKSGRNSVTFTTSDEIRVIYLYADVGWAASNGFTATFNGILIEEGSEPPTVYPVSFLSPVYGGEHEAVSGKLMDGWAKVEIKNCYYSGTWDGSKGAYWYITLGEDVVAPKKKTGSGLGMCESLLPVSNVSMTETRDAIAIFDNNIVRWIDTEHMTLTRQEYREYLANNPIVICYQIATPQEIQLTPTQITAIVGDNTIWSDADGSMTAVYLKKG